MSKEMEQRGYAYKNYRYRRFQALDDALIVYFHIRDAKCWVNVSDVCDMMEWDYENPSTRRRVRRICQSLERVGRAKIKSFRQKGDKGHWRGPLFMKVLE